MFSLVLRPSRRIFIGLGATFSSHRAGALRVRGWDTPRGTRSNTPTAGDRDQTDMPNHEGPGYPDIDDWDVAKPFAGREWYQLVIS